MEHNFPPKFSDWPQDAREAYLDLHDQNLRLQEIFDAVNIEQLIDTSTEIHATDTPNIAISRFQSRLNNEKRLQGLVMQNMRECIVQINLEQCVEYANPAFCNLIQQSFSDIVGQSLTSIWNVEIDADTHELSFQKPSGEVVWLSISMSELGQSGTVYVFTDITRRKQAEAETLRLKEHYQMLLEAVSDYSYMMRIGEDETLHMDWMGGTPEAVIGYTKEEFQAGSIYNFAVDVTDPGYRALMEQSYLDLLENKRTFIETIVRHKNGAHVWLSIIRQPIWDSNQQRVVGYYGAITDISRFKQAQEALREQESLKQALYQERELKQLRNHYLSTIAHDFRTPLTAISLANQSLQRYDDELSVADQDKYLNRIDISVQYLTKMIDEVTLVLRAEEGNFEFKPILVNPQEFCADLLHDFATISPHEQIILFSVVGPIVDSHLDKDVLNHILLNLLSNAIKYSPPNSTIVFNLSQDLENTQFEIIDKGIGIPQEEQHLLFEPFHRAPNANFVNGTGLGLSIVKRMVALHHGTIEFESEVNHGTKFVVSIPIDL